MDVDEVAEQPHRGNGVPEMTVIKEKHLQKNKKPDIMCAVFRVRPERYSSIAQSVEHAAVNRAVVGSSPTRGVLAPWSSG